MSDAAWWESVASALGVGQRIANSVEEFDEVGEHVVQLLRDSSLLLENGSASTACFLAITALEETAKVHIDLFRHSAVPVARGKDPLFKHKEKHRIAAAPTLAMGSRLQKAIGETRLRELMDLARNGGLVPLRESCLYVERKDGTLRIPNAVVSKGLAREMLLFAAESFDDAVVGFTNKSFDLGVATDELFAKWQAA
jgi:AbiV family abortive infection protein